MNKVLIGLVAGLVLVAVGAPAVCGWAIERGAEERLRNLTDLASFLSVRDHTFHRGWFSSEEVITFEVGAGLDVPLPLPAPGGAATPPKRPAFVVRNIIHHGPLPGLSTVALASIETHVEAAPGAAPLAKLPPAVHGSIATTLDFTGGGRTVLSGAAIPDTDFGDGVHMTSDGGEIDFDFGPHFDTLAVTGKLPHFLMRKDGAMTMEANGWEVKFKAHRVLRSLYASDVDGTLGDFEITDLAMADPKLAKFGIRAARYVSSTSATAGFLDGTGVLTAREAHAAGKSVQGIKLDVAIEHWQADAFEKLMAGLRKARNGAGAPAERVAEMTKIAKESGVTLLVNDPVVRVRDLELSTEEGFAKVSASFRINGATAKDFEPPLNPAVLLKKVRIEADISLDDELADLLDRPRTLPNSRTPAPSPLAGLIMQGYVTRAKGKTSTKFALIDGEPTLNGKPFSPAALAPPPPPARPGKPSRARPTSAGA